MAAKLGCPVQVIQRLTSSKEFNRWRVYLDQEANQFNPEFYYYALIAYIIAKANSKESEKLKLDDFLLKFEIRKEKKSQKLDPKTKEALAKMNKKLFLQGLGLNPDAPQKVVKKTPLRRLEKKTLLKKK